jgi:hypothetical protein
MSRTTARLADVLGRSSPVDSMRTPQKPVVPVRKTRGTVVAFLQNGQATIALDGTDSIPNWTALHGYNLADTVNPLNGYIYRVIGSNTQGFGLAGTSGAGAPTWPLVLGHTVADATVVWRCESQSMVTADVIAHYAPNIGDVVEVDTFAGRLLVTGTIATESGGWAALPLAAGWSNYGAPFAPAEYRKVGDIVYLRGLVKNLANGATFTFILTALPSAAYNPPYQLLLDSHGSVSGTTQEHMRLDLQTDGHLSIAPLYGGGDVDFLSLDQLYWSMNV